MTKGILTTILLFSMPFVLLATAEEKADSAVFSLRQVNDTLNDLELRHKEQVSRWKRMPKCSHLYSATTYSLSLVVSKLRTTPFI